jgi:hypothetical protein
MQGDSTFRQIDGALNWCHQNYQLVVSRGDNYSTLRSYLPYSVARSNMERLIKGIGKDDRYKKSKKLLELLLNLTCYILLCVYLL